MVRADHSTGESPQLIPSGLQTERDGGTMCDPHEWEGIMANAAAGALVIGVAASGIWFCIETGVIRPTLFRDDAQSQVDRAKAEALRAEALRAQQAAARANAEAEAERIRQQVIDEENRRARQAAAQRAREQTEADRLEQQRRDSENRQRRLDADLAAQRAASNARRAAEAEAIERSRRAQAYSSANNGCPIGTHSQYFDCQTSSAPQCLHIGGNGGYACVRD